MKSDGERPAGGRRAAAGRWPVVEAFETAMKFVMSDDHEPANDSLDLTDRIVPHERQSTLGRTARGTKDVSQ